jgi:hypothetical protein
VTARQPGARRTPAVLALALGILPVTGCGGGDSGDAAGDRGDQLVRAGATFVLACHATPDAALGARLSDVTFDLVSSTDPAAFTAYPIRGVDSSVVLAVRGPRTLCNGESQPGQLIAYSSSVGGTEAAALVDAAAKP